MYSIEEDHKALKLQIKRWEVTIDSLLTRREVEIDSVAGLELEHISNEMMAINI